MAQPKRPRAHELETESQRAFEGALPAWLVVRPVSDDYGIDREVEVFEDGEATGLTFKVQLKGTDGSGRTRRIRREALNYWRSLDVPVLIVCYEATTGLLRCRWAHSVGADAPDGGAAKLTVHLAAMGDITNEWAAGLAADLGTVRALRAGDLPVPIPIRLNYHPDATSPTVSSSAAILAELLHAARASGQRLFSRAVDGAKALEFDVFPDKTRVSLPLLWASATIHTPEGGVEHGARPFVREMIAVAATVVANVDGRVAGKLGVAAGPTCSWWASSEVARQIGPLLADASPDFLAAVMQHLLECSSSEDSWAAEMAYEMALHPVISSVSDQAFEAWAAVILQQAEREPTRGSLFFNLAHLYRARRDYAMAVDLFDQAGLREPRYLDDPLYQRSLAGACWEVGAFRKSADAYEAARSCGGDPQELLPLQADSLMCAGFYGLAADCLKGWEPMGEERDRVGVIRMAILSHITAVLGVAVQDRVAPSIATVDGSIGDGEEGVLEQLRTTDALNPDLWLLLVADHQPATAFMPLLIAATMTIDRASLWLTALLCALASEQPEHMVHAIMNEGRLHCPDAFYEGIDVLADGQESENASFLRELRAAIYERDPVSFGTTFRIIDSTSATDWIRDEVTIGGPGTGSSRTVAEPP